MYERKGNSILKHLDFIILDEVALLLSFVLAWYTRFDFTKGPFEDSIYVNIWAIMALMLIAAGSLTGNYHDILRRGYFVELTKVLTISAMTLALTTVIMYMTKSSKIYSRLLIFYSFLYFVPIDYVLRLLQRKIVKQNKKSRKENNRNVLIVTDSPHAKEIRDTINADYIDGYKVKALALTDYEEGYKTKGAATISLDNAAEYICREWIDEVFVYLPDGGSAQEFVADCAEMAVTVHTVINLHNADTNKQFIENIANKTVLTTAYNYMTPLQVFVKRAMDIAGGLIGSVLALIVIILVWPFVYAKDPGPILFKQERIGKNGKHFNMYKIRSMYMDADKRKEEYSDRNKISSGLMFKMEDDPRVLPGIGTFIRKISLDEFPQFFNVLKGDMSLVGTRPPTVDEWEQYRFHHRARMAIKPGITGLWQISGRSNITDFNEVVKLDTYYISHFRISQDIKILFKTIIVLFKRKGAM